MSHVGKAFLSRSYRRRVGWFYVTFGSHPVMNLFHFFHKKNFHKEKQKEKFNERILLSPPSSGIHPGFTWS